VPRSIEAKTSTNFITEEKLKSYLLEALKASNANPPDTEYQRGYLGALRALFEDLCMSGNERIQHRVLETAILPARGLTET